MWGAQQLLRLQAWWAGEAGLPLVLSVADISPGAGRRTDTGQVRWRGGEVVRWRGGEVVRW